MKFDLIEDQVFHFQVVDLVNIYIYIFGVDMSSSAHTDNKKKTYQFLEKDQHKDKNIL